jgi:hypothetical protein
MLIKTLFFEAVYGVALKIKMVRSIVKLAEFPLSGTMPALPRTLTMAPHSIPVHLSSEGLCGSAGEHGSCQSLVLARGLKLYLSLTLLFIDFILISAGIFRLASFYAPTIHLPRLSCRDLYSPQFQVRELFKIADSYNTKCMGM